VSVQRLNRFCAGRTSHDDADICISKDLEAIGKRVKCAVC